MTATRRSSSFSFSSGWPRLSAVLALPDHPEDEIGASPELRLDDVHNALGSALRQLEIVAGGVGRAGLADHGDLGVNGVGVVEDALDLGDDRLGEEVAVLLLYVVPVHVEVRQLPRLLAQRRDLLVDLLVLVGVCFAERARAGERIGRRCTGVAASRVPAGGRTCLACEHATPALRLSLVLIEIVRPAPAAGAATCGAACEGLPRRSSRIGIADPARLRMRSASASSKRSSSPAWQRPPQVQPPPLQRVSARACNPGATLGAEPRARSL